MNKLEQNKKTKTKIFYSKVLIRKDGDNTINEIAAKYFGVTINDHNEMFRIHVLVKLDERIYQSLP